MKKYSLKTSSRIVVGRKTKKIRREGSLPATIYGKKVKSVSVQVKTDEFEKVYKQAGETGLVELALDKETRPVLIHNVQLDPVSGTPLHVEFYQVDLKEKVKTRVPIEFVGEAPAVSQKLGVLLTLLDELEIEALPAELPDKISVDVSGLGAVDQEIKVGELKVPSGVTVLSDAKIGVVKVGPLITKEAEAEAAAEAAAAAAKAAEAAAAAPTEGAPAEAATSGAAKEEAAPAKQAPTEKPQEEQKK